MMQEHTLQDRHRNVRAMMARAGVDTLICAGNGHHMIDLDNAIAHMTGYRSVGPALLVLRPHDLHAAAGGALAVRSLRFEDRRDGSVAVLDARSGQQVEG